MRRLRRQWRMPRLRLLDRATAGLPAIGIPTAGAICGTPVIGPFPRTQALTGWARASTAADGTADIGDTVMSVGGIGKLLLGH